MTQYTGPKMTNLAAAPIWVLLSRANEPETVVVVAVVRSVVAPVRNRTVEGVVAPATTAYEAVRARRSAARVVHSLTSGYTAIPIPTPFKYVSTHIVQIKCVRCFFLNFMCAKTYSFTTSSTACNTIITYIIQVPAYTV